MIRGERIQTIDGIRGLSLFGILLANLLIFQYGIWGKDEIHFYSLSALDHGAYLFIKIFIEGSFMPIFTFLFGYSMIMVKESIERKGLGVKRHIVRRAIFLLIVGFLHGTYLWEGDILFVYGMMSIFLLLFVKRQSKTLLIWGIVFLLITVALSFGNEDPYTIEERQSIETYVETTAAVYGTGTYMDIKTHRLNEEPIEFDGITVTILFLASILYLAPMFLFGMFAGKKQAFARSSENGSIHLKWGILFTFAGLIGKSSPFLFPHWIWINMLDMLGGSLLSLGYIFFISVGYHKLGSHSILRRFECVGKLSLTNYLIQTVICTTIFYGYGLGLFGNLGVLASISLGLLIYACQVIFSSIYLTYFKTGPLEKINRIWTYFSFSGTAKKKRRDQREVAWQHSA